MAVDKQKFNEFLVRQAQLQGRRISGVQRSENPNASACAISCSALQMLRHAAAAKPLSAKDIALFYDTFLEAAGMEEYETPMGAIAYRPKEESKCS